MRCDPFGTFRQNGHIFETCFFEKISFIYDQNTFILGQDAVATILLRYIRGLVLIFGRNVIFGCKNVISDRWESVTLSISAYFENVFSRKISFVYDQNTFILGQDAVATICLR